MTIQTLPQSASVPAITARRRRLLRVHGVFLALAGTALAIYCTVARFTGFGPYAFLLQNPMAFVGLVQAYLLMTLLAVVLLIGSGQPQARKWDVIGALAHLPPIAAVLLSWSVLQSQGFLSDAYVSLGLHFFWIVVETIAILYPDPAPHH